MSIERRSAAFGKGASGTGRLDAALDRISRDPARCLAALTVLGVVAVTWVGLVGALLLRPPAPQPEALAALPPLAEALSHLADAESNADGQAVVEPAEPREPESASAALNPSHEASLGPAPPASPRLRTHEKPLDTAAHSANLPGAKRSEASYGQGDRSEEPRHVDERDREATPARVNKPTPREASSHGTRALTITTGHRYAATVTLSGFECFADNGRIASVLTGAGFANVTVTGSGGTRSATGTWTGATMTRAVDPHLSNVRDLSV
jgi:hypothetical protein